MWQEHAKEWNSYPSECESGVSQILVPSFDGREAFQEIYR